MLFKTVSLDLILILFKKIFIIGTVVSTSQNYTLNGFFKTQFG